MMPAAALLAFLALQIDPSKASETAARAMLDAVPAKPPEPTDADKKCEPVKTGRELLDHREDGDSLDQAVRMLEFHAAKPDACLEIQVLATEAYVRGLDRLQENKAQEKATIRRYLALGKPHGEASLKLAPNDGAAQYWRACLLLHEADWTQSLSKANEALALLEKAEVSGPTVDDGGPSRMRGHVLAEMPLLFGGSLSTGVQHLKRSLEISPNNLTAHLWLGEAYADQKKWGPARQELEGVVAAKPRPGHEKEDGADQKAAAERIKKLKH
ncbi:MAG TPA: tetratricopeptide repeat protein [Planctomycetota bacterium]|nr:tetratricopeptide repeat protein [Planctomycetota bacterium]